MALSSIYWTGATFCTETLIHLKFQFTFNFLICIFTFFSFFSFFNVLRVNLRTACWDGVCSYPNGLMHLWVHCMLGWGMWSPQWANVFIVHCMLERGIWSPRWADVFLCAMHSGMGCVGTAYCDGVCSVQWGVSV